MAQQSENMDTTGYGWQKNQWSLKYFFKERPTGNNPEKENWIVGELFPKVCFQKGWTLL